MIAALSVLALVTMVLEIRAEYRGPRRHVYVLKPLTTALILAVALASEAPVSTRYQLLIAAGLAFSMAGDIFLMLPSDRFLPGLVSFFVAHILYIAAFSEGMALRFDAAVVLPLLACSGILLVVLLPRAGHLKVAVTAYGLILVTMTWAAAERWLQLGGGETLLAAVGAVLFLASDSTLATNRFAGRFAAAQALILATYFPAQWLIALSV